MDGRRAHTSAEDAWAATVDLYRGGRSWEGDYAPRLGREYRLGIVVSPHRLFSVGDVVIVTPSNGDNRQPVYCRSGRGYSVSGCYVSCETKSYKQGGREFVLPGVVRLVEHPGDLAGFSPDHPDVRRFAVALAREGSARRVGASSPANQAETTISLRPQELFRPKHLLMPLETASLLMGVSAEELLCQINSGKSPQLKLISMTEGKFVEYRSLDCDQEDA